MPATNLVSLIESWDGRTWSVEPAATPAATEVVKLNDLSCPSQGRCIAVGIASSSTVMSNGRIVVEEQLR
jgi:hypothetical protein